MGNIVEAVFRDDTPTIIAGPLYQYDYGQILRIDGVNLPDAYEVHFANKLFGVDSTTQIGGADGVSIPDVYLTTGKPVYAWIYLHAGENDGETVRAIEIPVRKRAKPSNDAPDPVEQDVITQTIAALNAAVEKSETNVTHYPAITDGEWYVWDAEQGAFVPTGMEARGEKGEPGADGNGIERIRMNVDYSLSIYFTDGTSYTTDPIRGEKGDRGDPFKIRKTFASIDDMMEYTGSDVTEGDFVVIASNVEDPDNARLYVKTASSYQFITDLSGAQGIKGEDGFSPTVSVSKSGRQTTIIITDKYGTAVAEIFDGEGVNILDDNAGAGVTDKTWTANKLTNDLSDKADKTDTVLNTTLSRGRKAGSVVGLGSVAFGDGVEASGSYSHAEGESTVAGGSCSHAEGMNTKALNYRAHAEGTHTRATGDSSHAEGFGSGDSQINYYKLYVRSDAGHEGELDVQRISASAGANGYVSHSEGYETAANGSYTHAEGYMAYAVGNYAHAEGEYTYANTNAHAEGYQTSAVGNNSHSEGHSTLASGNAAHTEGDGTYAYGPSSHAEGYATKATSYQAHAEGDTTTAAGSASHAEGYKTTASQGNSHAEGAETVANGYAAHAEGYKTIASNAQAHAEGQETVASASNSHAEGYKSGAYGDASHAEGTQTVAPGQSSHAEGSGTTASGTQSHAEGAGTTASGSQAHSEGSGTRAIGNYSHAEGGGTTAAGTGSHAEGASSQANGDLSHAEGNSTHANGPLSHAEGEYTVANGAVSHVSGRYNVPDDYTNWPEWVANTVYAIGDKVKRTTTENNETVVKGYICSTANSDSSFDSSKWVEDFYINYAVIVGNGKYNNPSNAYSLDWDGNGHFAGDVYVGCNADGTGGTKLGIPEIATTSETQAIITEYGVSA